MSWRDVNDVVDAVQFHLSDDLRRAPWKGSKNRMAGHCFVASEAIYYLLGGKEAGWKPMSMRHEGSPHWYLWHVPSGRVVDATASQFYTEPAYCERHGKGFTSSRPSTPSKRAQVLMDRVMNDPDAADAVMRARRSLGVARSNPRRRRARR